MRSSRSKGTARLARKPKRSSNLAHARRVSALFEDIGDLDRFTARRRPAHHSVSQPRWIGAQRVDEFLFHMIGGAQEKLFRGLVVFVNRPAVGAAQLDRVGNDSRQHGFEIESGADRLTDFAERFELAYRACQFVGSLIQFFEQPHVLDGDHGLVGEGFKQLDLLVSKGVDLACDGSE